jgi:hypothetical protein
MENPGLSKYTVSYGLALALASVVNGLLVVAKESSPAVQAGMQKLTGHHWVTHSAIVLGLFFLTGWLCAHARGGQGPRLAANRLLAVLVSGVALGGLIIVGFYLVGD